MIHTLTFKITLRTKNVIIVALLLQVIITILVIIDSPVLTSIAIVRICFSLFYLIFLPGLLILLILKIRLNFTETVLYSVALSISSITFFVTFFNILLRSIGFERPISAVPLVLALAGFTLILCIVAYMRSKDFSNSFHLKLPLVPLLSLWLLPISTYGAYQLIAYDNNVLLLMLYAIISVYPLLVALDKVPKEIYSFIIWVISISLNYPLFARRTTVEETIIPGVIIRYGFWDPAISHPHNSLLFNTIIHPTIFYICGFANILDELKIVLPLISSFIPVILYSLFRKRFDEKTAFLSSLLFPFFYQFFGISSARQLHAMFFLAIFLLSILNDNLSSKNKALLLIIFTFSLITSHYGVSYLFMIVLFISIGIIFSLRTFLRIHLKSFLFYPSYKYLYLYLTATLGWYTYTAGSINLITFIEFYKFFLEHIGCLFSPELSHTLAIITRNWNSLSIEILKYFIIFIIGLITVGILKLFYEQVKERKVEEYLVLSASFLIVLGITLLPIGGGFASPRIFHITLISLAPFSVIGLKVMLRRLSDKLANNHSIFFAGLTIVFFLFNCGFIAEFIPNDYSPNTYIHKKKIMSSDNIQAKYLLYRDYYEPSQDVQASEWIQKYGKTDTKLYTDSLGWKKLRTSKYGKLPEEMRLPKLVLLNENVEWEKDFYLFLAHHNNVEKLVFIIERNIVSVRIKVFSLDKLDLKNISIIYNNGCSIFGKT